MKHRLRVVAVMEGRKGGRPDQRAVRAASSSKAQKLRGPGGADRERRVGGGQLRVTLYDVWAELGNDRP
jgi:hypothetical protein